VQLAFEVADEEAIRSFAQGRAEQTIVGSGHARSIKL